MQNIKKWCCWEEIGRKACRKTNSCDAAVGNHPWGSEKGRGIIGRPGPSLGWQHLLVVTSWQQFMLFESQFSHLKIGVINPPITLDNAHECNADLTGGHYILIHALALSQANSVMFVRWFLWSGAGIGEHPWLGWCLCCMRVMSQAQRSIMGWFPIFLG